MGIAANMYLYNTLTKTKEKFAPLVPGKIGLYVCGITVYDYCHIGHARVMVAFDMMTRYFRALGYEVCYVRNITDIDDKIIKRAETLQQSLAEVTEKFITLMHEDFAQLGVLKPDIEPRATMHIRYIIQMIQVLLERKAAYIADDGDVYYDVSTFASYGTLAHQDLDKLRAGARVDVVASKHDPLDFVLWKLAKPGEPEWDSPWGKGRPGWHIECSAMSTHCLDNTFDIHGGGVDLVFPHHQNEIAQSEAATGQRFVRNWLHVGHVQIDKQKMSKSLDNFFTIREVLAQYPAEVVRYFLLASHYRSPINYTSEALTAAKAALQRLYGALNGLSIGHSEIQNNDFSLRFHQAMQDDFNTPEALAVLFDLAREINRLRDTDLVKATTLAQQLKSLGQTLGLLQQAPEKFLNLGDADTAEATEINSLVAARNAARANKEWSKADIIRAQLLARGILLEDTSQGTVWRKE